MKNIYILFTRFPDNGTKVIGTLTGSHYPHASIGLEEDMNTFYSFVTKGFIVEKITRYLKPARAPFLCELYELKVTDEVYGRIKRILKNFEEFKSLMHYAKTGLVLSLLHIPHRNNGIAYFCSQFVAEVLNIGGAAELKKNSNKYFSRDLKKLPGMRKKFSGNVKTLALHFGLLHSPQY